MSAGARPPKALVVLRDGADLRRERVDRLLPERLAAFKCPTSVELRESLPRTATGKVQKYRLREPYWRARSESI